MKRSSDVFFVADEIAIGLQQIHLNIFVINYITSL